MGRNGSAQEVSCVVALPTSLYPALLPRKPPASASTNAAAAAAAVGAGSMSAELGGSPQETLVPGVVLEVRQLWQPTSSHDVALHPSAGEAESPAASAAVLRQRGVTSSSLHADTAVPVSEPLYAFVRVKDADHRLSGWFPLHNVYVKHHSARTAFEGSAVPPSSASPLPNEQTSVEDLCAAVRGVGDDMTPLSRVLRRPWLSAVYEEVTPGMARTQRARRQLDYLEERLLRDCRTPTTVRYFVYMNTYVFAPWYYAPFGLLNSEYNPALPCGGGFHGNDVDSLPTSPARGEQGDAAAAAAPPPASAGSSPQQPQPFIRDAFLCPFSLRLFSTYAQLHYETRTHRAGRLRPPGEEIYRDELRGLSLFKINGSQHVTYCRHLFLIGKSFLENKLAGHDVHSYYFYVVCLHHRYFPHYVTDASAMYFAGFFTWEKQAEEYNLACIATLPCFGRRAAARRPPACPAPAHHGSGGQSGPLASPPPPPPPPPVLRNIGQFMIAVSYELAYRRKQIGTPEKPLSDLGAVAYQHYWRRALVRWMKETLGEMRRATAVDVDAAGGASPERRKEGGPSSSEVTDVVTVTIATEGGSGEPRGAKSGRSSLSAGKRKRPRTSSGGGNSAVTAVDDVEDDVSDYEEGDGVSAPVSLFTTRTTIKEIAAAVRLEEADVLNTLLGLGVLHRSSEDRSIQLLLPQRYVDWMYDEVLRWEGSVEHAVFQPALLKSRGRAK